MHFLFITYGSISLGGGDNRSVALLSALADAGHSVDVIASSVDLPDHSHIRILIGSQKSPVSKRLLRIGILRATSRRRYDAMHLVDEAALFSTFIGMQRKAPVIYDARRCFSGPAGDPPSVLWKLFPTYFERLEKKLLARSAAVLTHSPRLTADLTERETRVRAVESSDVPLQSLVARRDVDHDELMQYFEDKPSCIVLFRVLSDTRQELGKALRAARKITDSIPSASFFIRGNVDPEAAGMAASLDIHSRCVFLADRQTKEFLAALEIADASVLIPSPDGRYIHEDVYTLLRATAPLVAVQDAVHENLLNSANSIAVLSDAASIADGVLQTIHEPLFSRALAAQGQQLIADRFSYSSFKHRLRMVCNEVLKTK